MHFFNTILDSPYIIDKNEDVILKFQVEPINKQTYNFYLVRNKDNMYYLTYSIINVSYIFNELRKNHTEEMKNKYNQMSSKDKSLLYLIYDKITLKVYKQIFHPQCINL